MKVRLIAMILNFYSISAVAGYECTLQLSHADDLNKVVAEKSIRVERGQMISGHMGTLLKVKGQDSSLELNALISGWESEEDASFVILLKDSSETHALSETMALAGKENLTGWFDSYKVDITCDVKESAIDFL